MKRKIMTEKTIAVLFILALCLGVFAGCGRFQKKETAQPTETEMSVETTGTETESAAETETAAIPGTEENGFMEADEEYLFADLDLRNPADIETAADRILAISDLSGAGKVDQKAYPDGYNYFGVMKSHAQGGLVQCAYEYYLHREGEAPDSLTAKIRELREYVKPFSFTRKETSIRENGSDVIVELELTGAHGMSKVPPTLLCISRDQGQSWKYWLISYAYDFLYYNTSTDDLAFASKYLGNTASNPEPVVVVLENMGEKIWRKETGLFTPKYEWYFESDILALEEGENGQAEVEVGCRGMYDPELEDTYIQISRFDSASENGEVLRQDGEFLHMMQIYLEQADEEIFPESSKRNLTIEEIEAWKVLSERAIPKAYQEILERAVEEIHTRAGEELNDFEQYNIELLEEAEAEME